MRRFTKLLNYRFLSPTLSIALALNLMACGDDVGPEDREERQTSDSETGSEDTRSDKEETTSADDTESTVNETGGENNSDTPSASTSDKETDSTTEEPPKPTLNLSYRSIRENRMLLFWDTPETYSSQDVRYIVSSAEKNDHEVMFGESVMINTESQESDMEYSVSLYLPGQGVNLAETVKVPHDHHKDLPDFTTVTRPVFTRTGLTVQTVTLNLNPRSLAIRSLDSTLAAEEVKYHVYVDGQEQTKAYTGQDELSSGSHVLTGLLPGRLYNFQIQSSASPAADQVASEVAQVQVPALPAKTFEIPVASGTQLAVNQTSGARLPNFIQQNQMQVSIYVDGKKLDDDCKVVILPKVAATGEVALPKFTPTVYMGIKDSCYVQSAGAKKEVVYEASLKIEATGEVFVTKSTNTNIVHQPQ